MRTVRRQSAAHPASNGKLAELHARLAEAQDTLRALRGGEVDAVVVSGKKGPRVFTLEGVGHAYQMLIESMNEGALTLTVNKTILYANQCFAKMVKCPLQQVLGDSFGRFLAPEDQKKLRALLKRAVKGGDKLLVHLLAADGSQMPALISIRPLAGNNSKSPIVGMVVTDLTEARRNEELLRLLSHHVVQMQEIERGRVALELHDNITQPFCAILVRWQALANKLPARDRAARAEVRELSELLGQNVEEVQRIGRNLRPSVLEHLGLAPVLRSDGEEFARRTGVSLKLTCVELTARLPADAELACYRILQEALKNVEHHARAHHVTVDLVEQNAIVQLTIQDDGIGFDPEHPPAKRKAHRGFGLFSMRERATAVGGTLTVKSVPGKGTAICVQIALRRIRGRALAGHVSNAEDAESGGEASPDASGKSDGRFANPATPPFKEREAAH